jgi:hypothetical protein
LAEADAAFESRFGYRRKGQWVVEFSDPTRRVCLQAADYFLWAVQRFFEIRFDGTTQQPVMDKSTGAPVREDRFLNALWPQIMEIHDLHFGECTGCSLDPCASAQPCGAVHWPKNEETADIGTLRFSRHGAEFCLRC